ncbi:MAG: shikimate dehydrogenase [Parvibaculaceae bacterium]|nr:shikimate dehydrogenase [Parvibaculaceae bacterium]
MRKVCVMGWPISHSRSPLIHNYWIEKYGVADALYERLAVEPEKLAGVLENFGKLSYVGGNVTVPHKEAVFALLADVDATARRLKAVNTIVTTPSGLQGRNTDGYGFIANLRERSRHWRPENGPAVMVGAGGAARAIAAVLEESGVPELRIVNRTITRADTLIGDLGLQRAISYDWDHLDRALEGAALLVQTTSLGMTGMAPLDLKLDALPISALVTDIVYTPLITPLLAAARARGNDIVDGLGMLLHQAVPGFEAWFGVRPEVTPELRALVLADMGIAEEEPGCC